LYGLLLLSDTLLLNVFGLDRGASQAYFVMPLPLKTVLAAKNLTAVIFVVLQNAVILLVAALVGTRLNSAGITSGILASAVVTVFLLAIGNWTSLSMPKPADPKQTFRKQAGAKMQIWLFGSAVGLFVLIGFAFLARYALQSDWVLLAVLSFELLIGIAIYCMGLESAVERGIRDREKIIQLLSRSGSPVSFG
jgi:ABC-2 type transport system permease protein